MGFQKRLLASALAPSILLSAAPLLMSGAAQADCTPAAANNVTATCTGTTTNQGGGAPGTSAGTDGYGTGVETGISVDVAAGAAVKSDARGINIGDGTVTNNAGASITGRGAGILASTGAANVTNSGKIESASSHGIGAYSSATVTNNAGASISGGMSGIFAFLGAANVTNSGSIAGTGTDSYGIYAGASATVTNSGTVSGGRYGISADRQDANVTNSGSITGASYYGISAFNTATVTNNAGASIKGGTNGIVALGGTANVTNSGSIEGTNGHGIGTNTSATVTNNAGASITGDLGGILAVGGSASVTNSGSIAGTGTNGNGIYAGGAANVTNSGSIAGSATSGYGIYAGSSATVTNSGRIADTGTDSYGIYAGTSATVTNSGTVSGGRYGISARQANVTNSGSITGASYYAISALSTATVTNNAGASIKGGTNGIAALGGAANVTNSGKIEGTNRFGIGAYTSATVTNNAGASITGDVGGILAAGGFASVTNSGSIAGTGTNGNGIYAGSSATVTNNAGASITGGLYGISANGGSSLVFNAGSITGATAAIQFAGTNNTLTLAPGSAISGAVLGTGSDVFQLGGSGAASFDISQLGAAAQYQGFGSFNKIDSSTWTLTGTSTFAGPVNVNGGTLIVNGDFSTASSFTVNAGGTLAGTGIVDPPPPAATTINSGGTLAPGMPGVPGTFLTITGNLAFQSGALYALYLNPTSSTFANVSGTATLAGNVLATLAPGSYTKQNYYDILHAAGGLNGSTFAGASTSMPGFVASLSYTSTDVFLNLTAALGGTGGAGGGLAGNQQNVATVINNFFNGGGSLPPGFVTLFGLSGANLANAITQVSGEVASTSQQTTFEAMNLFMGVLTDPFGGDRGENGTPGMAVLPYADEGALASASARPRSNRERDAYAAVYGKAPIAQVYEPRWSVWAAGFGGSQTTDGDTALGSNTTSSRIAAGAVGADYRVSPSTIAGFAFAGGGTNYSVADGGTGRSDLFQAGAFVRHTNGPGYVTAAAAYGWQDVTTDRVVTVAGLDHLRAEFNANAYSGRLETGYRVVAPSAGGVGLTPYAAGQFTTFALPAYAESAVLGANTFALAYAAKTVTATRSELGFRADRSFVMDDGVLTLRGRAAWAHDFNPDRAIAATFQALPGASFVVNGAAQASEAALATASAEWKWRSGVSLAATFEGEFSNVTRSYAGKGVVRYQW